jgi:DNA-binding NtrC family response regulator
MPRLSVISEDECVPRCGTSDRTGPARTKKHGSAIISQTQTIRSLIETTIRVAPSSAAVLITGESGTGKELFSRLVHDASNRSEQPLVTVNCAAMADNLIESELFGHEKGAFTDAVSRRIGRFEVASGGTLLLDEVTEIPLKTQAKLLRAIEENEISRVGSNDTIPTNVRIVATSNRNLSIEVQAKRFRLDLFHRLNVVQINLPPLREHTKDIPLLAQYFLNRFKTECTTEVQGFTRSAMRILCSYHWPGNIRELRNVVHRCCILAHQPLIDKDCLPEFESQSSSNGTQLPAALLEMPLAETERRIILASLKKHGSKKNAAAALGVTSRTLSNKLRIYAQTDSDPSPGSSTNPICLSAKSA